MRFIKACRREKTDATPVWFMRQAGRYMPEYRALRAKWTLLEMCERPELAAEVSLQPLRLGVDAVILFADILLPVRPVGVKLEFVKGEGPALTPAVRTAGEIDALRDFDPASELSYVMGALRILRRELEGKVPLIGFAGAPFTLAAYLVEGGPSEDHAKVKAMMRSEPALWDRLMRKLSKVTADYLLAQAAAGAQVLQLFDSWAGALTREEYVRCVQPHSRAVFSAVAKAGVPLIHFGTNTGPFLEDLRDAGGDVIGVDHRVPLDEAWKRIGCDRAVQGNLDPEALLGPRDELLSKVDEVLRRAGGRPGHIFNLGHGILQQTPVENVRAVADRVHEKTA
ncbi:MAG: uroporphyrinogen decarboxylase [Elusimicrobiota bacterium]|jgi:uroporphyrinogen decarboxylase